MIVLKIIGIVLAALLGLVLLVLLLWVDVCAEQTEKHGFRLYLRVLGLPFGRKTRKKALKNQEKQPKKKPKENLSANLRKVLGLSHTEKEEGGGNTLGETAELVKELVGQILWLVKRFRIPRFRVTVAAGGAEAALEYGLACAVVYPLATYLQETAGLKERRMQLRLGCDFAREKTLYELELTIRIPVFYAAVAALRILKRNLTKEQ